MAIKSKDELLDFIKKKSADDSSDDTLQFIEDITDTLNNYDTELKDKTDWKEKYKENDKQWRDKYKERFFSNDDTGTDDSQIELDDTKEEKKPMKFEDLFSFKK